MKTPQISLFSVTMRVKAEGTELNPTFPVMAFGFDDAVEMATNAAERLGLTFCFVHRVEK